MFEINNSKYLNTRRKILSNVKIKFGVENLKKIKRLIYINI